MRRARRRVRFAARAPVSQVVISEAGQGRYAEAEPLYKRSLAIREKVLGPEHPGVAQSLNNLAALYKAQGQYAEAEPLYQRALAIREKALGSEHPHVAQSLNNLAGLYEAQGRYAEAEPPQFWGTRAGLVSIEKLQHHTSSAQRVTGL